MDSNRGSIDVLLSGCKIASADSVRYLGAHLDRSLSDSHHIRKTMMKASQATSALARVMSNKYEPSETMRPQLTLAMTVCIVTLVQ